MPFQINGNIVITDDRLVKLPTTRPASPSRGMIFFNTSTLKIEVYDGTTWRLGLSTSTPFSISPALTWGINTWGNLGDNSTTTRSSPVNLVGGITDWTQISAGNSHTAAIRASGTAWAWGSGTSGRLGDNTTTQKNSPVSVVGGFTDWTQISAGNSHTAAIRANGTAWSWGSGSSGLLGNNSTTGSSSPVSVVGGFTDWTQISAGRYHTAALRSNGTAWTWGQNGQGQLGDYSTTSRSSPVSVVGGFTDWIQISANGNAGNSHTVAIRANGTAWSWGSNASGRLGDNSTTSRSSPVSVVGGFTDWVQVSAGGRHCVALRANGTAWAWGDDLSSQLGDNSTTNRSSPVSVVGGFTDWVQVSGGYDRSGAVRANGTAWSWGAGTSGQLGNNAVSTRSSPVSVVGGFTDWVQISVGTDHTAALRTQPKKP